MNDKKEKKNKVQMPMSIAIEKSMQELIDKVNELASKYNLTNYMLFQITNNINQIVAQNLEQEKAIYEKNLKEKNGGKTENEK